MPVRAHFVGLKGPPPCTPLNGELHPTIKLKVQWRGPGRPQGSLRQCLRDGVCQAEPNGFMFMRATSSPASSPDGDYLQSYFNLLQYSFIIMLFFPFKENTRQNRSNNSLFQTIDFFIIEYSIERKIKSFRLIILRQRILMWDFERINFVRKILIIILKNICNTIGSKPNSSSY